MDRHRPAGYDTRWRSTIWLPPRRSICPACFKIDFTNTHARQASLVPGSALFCARPRWPLQSALLRTRPCAASSLIHPPHSLRLTTWKHQFGAAAHRPRRQFLKSNAPDVLCLQETNASIRISAEGFQRLGYDTVALNGQKGITRRGNLEAAIETTAIRTFCDNSIPAYLGGVRAQIRAVEAAGWGCISVCAGRRRYSRPSALTQNSSTTSASSTR